MLTIACSAPPEAVEPATYAPPPTPPTDVCPVDPAAVVPAAYPPPATPRVDLQQEAAGIRWEKLSGRIVYARWDDTDSKDPRGLIFLIDVPARELKLIRNVSTHGVPPYFDPGNYAREITFNPRGSAVTFTMIGASGHWELRTLDLASGAEQVLFPDCFAHNLYPSWSPDGHLAYYRIGGPPRSGLFIDGQFVGQVGGEGAIAWINSSSFIASGIGGLQRADLTGGAITQMVPGPSRFLDPAVDPGRGRLAYVRFDGPDVDNEEIWVAGIDGSSPTRVSHGWADYKPAWSPDGKSVLFVHFGAGLSLYDVASGSITQVTRKNADAVAWAP